VHGAGAYFIEENLRVHLAGKCSKGILRGSAATGAGYTDAGPGPRDPASG